MKINVTANIDNDNYVLINKKTGHFYRLYVCNQTKEIIYEITEDMRNATKMTYGAGFEILRPIINMPTTQYNRDCLKNKDRLNKNKYKVSNLMLVAVNESKQAISLYDSSFLDKAITTELV